MLSERRILAVSAIASYEEPMFWAAILASALFGVTAKTHAGDPTFVPEAAAAPAMRYAAMDANTCMSELQRRNLPWTPVPQARGILAPVRITGPLNGITFHSPVPKKDRATASIEIFDCRLALAVHDFSFILAQAGVVEVVHYSVYRDPGKRYADKLGSRHGGALAIDVGKLVRRDGTTLSVEDDFHGHIGNATCPMTYKVGPSPATDNAKLLWSIFCTAADAHLFNVALSPNYNKPHFNHFHLEVTANVKWFIAH